MIPRVRYDRVIPRVRNDRVIPRVRYDRVIPRIRYDRVIPRVRYDRVIPSSGAHLILPLSHLVAEHSIMLIPTSYYTSTSGASHAIFCVYHHCENIFNIPSFQNHKS